jgi:Uma2 family endonuclease
MATKTLMSVEEYLRTSFEGSDCEYLDGEVVERNMGELPHGRIQARIIILLTQVAAALGIQIVPEIRLQIRPTRFRVADVAVWRPGDIGERIPNVPPFLAIEILSYEDRMSRVLPKVQEYLEIGVEWVWLIDPEERSGIMYSKQDPAGHVVEVLRTEDPHIEIPLDRVFEVLS